MLPSVFIAAVLAGCGDVSPTPAMVQPEVVVIEGGSPQFEFDWVLHDICRPVLRFGPQSEYMKLLPPSDVPPAEPTPKRGLVRPPSNPFMSPPVATQPAPPPPPTDPLQERIKALECGIAALRSKAGAASSIESLQKELDALKRDATKSK
jgi:hypothetical protein